MLVLEGRIADRGTVPANTSYTVCANTAALIKPAPARAEIPVESVQIKAEMIRDALPARGYLLRESAGDEVVSAVRAEAAGILGLSPRSVETYRLRLMQKLGIENLASLVKFAIRHGMITIE